MLGVFALIPPAFGWTSNYVFTSFIISEGTKFKNKNNKMKNYVYRVHIIKWNLKRTYFLWSG